MATKSKDIKKFVPKNPRVLKASYEILGLDYENDPRRYERDLQIMNELEFEVAQAIHWNFHEETWYDLVVGYLGKGMLLPDDEISTNWLEYYEKEVKSKNIGDNLGDTMENSLVLSLVNVLSEITEPGCSYKKISDLEAHELNDLCIVFEAFCLELCYKLQFQFNFLEYQKNEFAISIVMLMRSYFFNPKIKSAGIRISQMTGTNFATTKNSCQGTVKTYLSILYEQLDTSTTDAVEDLVEEKSTSKKLRAEDNKRKDKANTEIFENKSSSLERSEGTCDSDNGSPQKNRNENVVYENVSSPCDKRKDSGNNKSQGKSTGSTKDSRGDQANDSGDSETIMKIWGSQNGSNEGSSNNSGDPTINSSDDRVIDDRRANAKGKNKANAKQSGNNSQDSSILSTPKSGSFNSISKILGQKRAKVDASNFGSQCDRR